MNSSMTSTPLPRVCRAIFTATHSKAPVVLMMLTITIMPISRPSTLRSIFVSSSGKPATPKMTMAAAPSMEGMVLSIFSDTISA